MTIKLQCFGESGHSYKAALGLELSGLAWTPVFVDFFNGGVRSDDYTAKNVMAEAPVLETGELTLTQSGAILQWITDETGKFGGEAGDKYEVLRWVLWDNHKMSSQMGVLRFLKNFVPEDKRNPDVIAFVEGRARGALKTLNTHLEGRDWIVGGGLTQADLSCCSYLFYPEPFGFNRKDLPNIDHWLANIEGTPGWKHPYDLMQRALPPGG